ncbi:MAG TPA: FAD-dependent oxidoreductase [Dehalococcoidales bacterium]|nr:FAD-dependent oxidoreductase [Dehalococcoidales bacterium]
MIPLTRLFSPIRVKNIELKNRIVFLAIGTDQAQDGMVTDTYHNFVVERAKGGAGLIISGCLSPFKSIHDQTLLGIGDDRYIPRLRELVRAVHQYESKIAGQIQPMYHFAKDANSVAEPVGPSEQIIPLLKQTARALTIEEIHQTVADCGEAARRCREAEFDAIELSMGMGYMLNRFLSPVTNKRTDEYGGSMENRMRLVLEIIRKMRQKTGNDFPIICRFSAEEYMEGGLTVTDWKIMAPILEKAGVDVMDVEAGWHECRKPLNQASVVPGSFAFLAEEIKNVVNVPVVAAYRINDPFIAEQILERGKVDLIGMGRSLIADPYLPNKAKEGRFDEIRTCLACNFCLSDVAKHESGGIKCTINPRVGREKETELKPTTKSKKVLVIGGGPAGMQAAMTAAARGHKVTLIEKGNKLGGQLLNALLPPYKEEIKKLVNTMTAQVKKTGVAVELNKQATVPFILENKPDAVIIAAGARPLIPNIPGVKNKNVATAIEVLTNSKKVGDKVVIVGGGLVGCETADFLAEKGKKITVVEMLGRMAADIPPASRWVLMQRLKVAGAGMESGTKVEEITSDGVRATRNGTPVFFAADTVVLATGFSPNKELTNQLTGKVPELYSVGDCVQAHRIKEAIEEGFNIGSHI